MLKIHKSKNKNIKFTIMITRFLQLLAKHIYLILAISFLIFSCKIETPSSVTSSTPSTPSLKIDQAYQGGKIIYIYQSGEKGYVANETHGIIVALNDLSASWGAETTLTNGRVINLAAVDSCWDGIGYGKLNTKKIINAFTNFTTSQDGKITYPTPFKYQTAYAAKMCDTLKLKGYDDWYLPTISEMQLASAARGVYANIIGSYWTSVSYQTAGFYYAYRFDSNGGALFSSSPSSQQIGIAKIRPIRYF